MSYRDSLRRESFLRGRPWGLATLVALASTAMVVASLTETAALKPKIQELQSPEQLAAHVISVRPHDPQAFTQGLLWHEGLLYESTGLRGQSSLREVDPMTGDVLRMRSLPAGDFGEGLALVGERLIQLTWQEKVAHIWTLADFSPAGNFAYEGEGWGLCFDGTRLVMSDGSDVLTFREPDTFEVIGQVDVLMDGQPLRMLNELECVDGVVWANVWFKNFIVGIDPDTGQVKAVVDGSPLDERIRRLYGHQNSDVLNGIAYDPTTSHFLVTGKRWPELFEVRFVPGPTATAAVAATLTAAPAETPTSTATATEGETPTTTAKPTADLTSSPTVVATHTPTVSATATPTTTMATAWIPFALRAW